MAALTRLSLWREGLPAGTAVALPSRWFKGPYAIKASVWGSDTHIYLSLSAASLLYRLCPGVKDLTFQIRNHLLFPGHSCSSNGLRPEGKCPSSSPIPAALLALGFVGIADWATRK